MDTTRFFWSTIGLVGEGASKLGNCPIPGADHRTVCFTLTLVGFVTDLGHSVTHSARCVGFADARF